jgi:hypothetical protein
VPRPTPAPLPGRGRGRPRWPRARRGPPPRRPEGGGRRGRGGGPAGNRTGAAATRRAGRGCIAAGDPEGGPDRLVGQGVGRQRSREDGRPEARAPQEQEREPDPRGGPDQGNLGNGGGEGQAQTRGGEVEQGRGELWERPPSQGPGGHPAPLPRHLQHGGTEAQPGEEAARILVQPRRHEDDARRPQAQQARHRVLHQPGPDPGAARRRVHVDVVELAAGVPQVHPVPSLEAGEGVTDHSPAQGGDQEHAPPAPHLGGQELRIPLLQGLDPEEAVGIEAVMEPDQLGRQAGRGGDVLLPRRAHLRRGNHARF